MPQKIFVVDCCEDQSEYLRLSPRVQLVRAHRHIDVIFRAALSTSRLSYAIPKNVGDRKVYRETINLPGKGSKILDTSVPIMWHSMLRSLYRRNVNSLSSHYHVIGLSAFRYHQIISDALRNVLAYKIILLIQKRTNHFFTLSIFLPNKLYQCNQSVCHRNNIM